MKISISVFMTNNGETRIISGNKNKKEEEGLILLAEEEFEEGASILDVFILGLELGIKHGEEIHIRRSCLD